MYMVCIVRNNYLTTNVGNVHLRMQAGPFEIFLSTGLGTGPVNERGISRGPDASLSAFLRVYCNFSDGRCADAEDIALSVVS